MTGRFRRPEPTSSLVVVDRIRAVEVPVLTETKRRIVRGDVGGALLYAYPKVVEDLGRAYGTTFPEGFAHEEIVARAFTAEMAPLREFFDQLYRWYAPVRFGRNPSAEAGEAVVGLLQSLYAAEPMWRLYVTPSLDSGPSSTPPLASAEEPGEPDEEESPWST
jgi:hypothetical protein